VIELADIPAAVATYLDTRVTTTISTVTPSNSNQDILTPVPPRAGTEPPSFALVPAVRGGGDNEPPISA
jgi:hypothetical protein